MSSMGRSGNWVSPGLPQDPGTPVVADLSLAPDGERQVERPTAASLRTSITRWAGSARVRGFVLLIVYFGTTYGVATTSPAYGIPAEAWEFLPLGVVGIVSFIFWKLPQLAHAGWKGDHRPGDDGGGRFAGSRGGRRVRSIVYGLAIVAIVCGLLASALGIVAIGGVVVYVLGISDRIARARSKRDGQTGDAGSGGFWGGTDGSDGADAGDGSGGGGSSWGDSGGGGSWWGDGGDGGGDSGD